MKAIRVHEPADIGGLVFEEAPDAKPFLCDVLVKVAACGITHNELDYPVWTCRAGHQRTLTIPSAEMSGVVAALGLGDRAQLTELARLVDQGHLRPQIGAVYPLAQAPEAQRKGRRRHARQGRPPALTQVYAEHAALYAVVEEPHPAGPPGGEMTAAAVRSLDPHQVNLVEACQRGLAVTGDPAFAAAAETVTGLR